MDHEPGDPPPNPQPRPHPVEAHREGVMPVAVPATHDPPEETWHDAPEEPLAGPPTHPDRLEGHPHPFPPPRFPDGGRYVQNEVYRAQAAALEESDIPLPAPSPRRLADAVVAVVALSVLAGIIILIKVFIWDRSGDAGWVYVVVVFFRVTVLVGGLPRLLREGGQVFSALAWPIWAVPPSPDFLEWATPLALPVLTSLVVRAGIWAPCKDAWNVHQYLPARTRENIRALLQAWWEFCKGSLQLSFGTAEAHKLVRSPGQHVWNLSD
ncbi:hypothetical protein QBC33DRAFT_595444 [Phialemonium atrogriseum]|uniref:Uncharacterized protein n=1 Tax=Phialemonium atrogriseum TaxID=1093897 RepID=A0AAJ0BU18_9PEZI|nr:uncharacterized protein QBC33DRAFT_595444 [Phialemonium atrogriseum]KAK1764221.1 hypothetical protein QBC33DRAFT_595444 [Phialemonium atrogriseum]